MKPLIFTQSDRIKTIHRLEYLISTMKPGKRYQLDIKEYREKRSIDANAYFWVLAHKLAEVMGIPVTDVYRNAIKEIGGVSTTGCFQTDDVEELCRLWEKKGMGWIAETYPSKIEGCTNIMFYKGSSEYDTDQMRRLIDNVVQDCKSLDIETETPERLEGMMEEWER